MAEYFTDGLRRTKGGRHFNYFALCFPWIVMTFFALTLDLVATYMYMTDYFKILFNSKYLSKLLDVKNPEEFENIIWRHDEIVVVYHVVVATTYMYSLTSKLFLPLMVFFLMGIVSIKSMWEVVAENKRIQFAKNYVRSA